MQNKLKSPESTKKLLSRERLNARLHSLADMPTRTRGASMTPYRYGLLAVFACVWAWSAWKPAYPTSWFLENLLVIVGVPAVFFLGRYFEFSDASYTLITAFLCLHVIGAHYTYEKVPLGYHLQYWLGANRNMYDRLVHFAFGLLLAYPCREAFLRLAKVRGFWGFYLPFDVISAFSGLFEIMEWIVVQVVDPSAGSAYLGTQGDEWDAQKDMLCASVGALIAMALTAAVNWWYLGNDFIGELKGSFRLRHDDEPLGELALQKMQAGAEP